MKKDFITILKLMALLSLVFTMNCTEHHDSLHENMKQSSDKKTRDELSQVIIEKFGSYENYLALGGLSIDNLLEIINENTPEEPNSYITVLDCVNEFSHDIARMIACIKYVDPHYFSNGGDNPDGAEEDSEAGPYDINEPLVDTRYEKLEYFFEPGTEAFDIIKRINHSDIGTINAALNILEQHYPDVVTIVQAYGGPFNGVTNMTAIIDTAERLGLFHSIYMVGHFNLYPTRDYFLLKNIAERRDGYKLITHYFSESAEETPEDDHTETSAIEGEEEP